MSDQSENVSETEGVEILREQSAISLITKAEIDVQISTAKAFPRSLKKFHDRAMSMATFNEEVAASCAYALPRKEYNQATGQYENKVIEGPSVRLAEIVVSAYGNIRAGMRVIHNDGKAITSQGICHDLETNSSVTLEVKRSILTKKGHTFSENMQVVTGNAANAIAYRNAVFKIVPTALIQDIYEKVKEVAKGTADTLVKRRENAMTFFRSRKIKDEQIFNLLDVSGIEDIDLDKLSVLRGMVASVKNGESTVEELFPAPEPKSKGDSATKATEEAIKRASDKAKEASSK